MSEKPSPDANPSATSEENPEVTERTDLPAPPGTVKKAPSRAKKEPKETPPMPTPEKAPEKPTGKKEKIPGWIVPAAAGLVLVLLVALALPSTKKNGQSPGVTAPEGTVSAEAFQTEIQKLLIKNTSLESRMNLLEGEAQSYEKQVKAYKENLQAVSTELETLKKQSAENRGYISTIYRQVLDVELKLESLGGGFGQKTPKAEEERVVNPYIQETLP
jgi:hypothetical protein